MELGGERSESILQLLLTDSMHIEVMMNKKDERKGKHTVFVVVCMMHFVCFLSLLRKSCTIPSAHGLFSSSSVNGFKRF